MNSLPSTPRAPSPEARHREMIVLLAYENLSAALRASELIGSLLRQVSQDERAQLRPWKFSSLQQSDQNAQATQAASAADLIVVAGSGASPALPEWVEAWLEKSLGQRRRGPTAVAALFGDPFAPDRPDSPRVKTVQRLADAAGCAFFAPHFSEPSLSAA